MEINRAVARCTTFFVPANHASFKSPNRIWLSLTPWRLLPVDGLNGSYACGRARNDAGQKSTSGRSPLISSKPVCGQLPVCRLLKNWLCRNTIRSWLRGELGQGYRECVRPPHRQVPRGASVDRGGSAPPCAASGGGYRWAASLPIADAISGSPPAAQPACRFGCAEPRRPG